MLSLKQQVLKYGEIDLKNVIRRFKSDWKRSKRIFVLEIPPNETGSKSEMSLPCAQMTKHEMFLTVIILNFCFQLPAEP